MKKHFVLVIVMILVGVVATGCVSMDSSVTVDEPSVEVPSYILVDKSDISTAQMTREAFWVAIEEKLSEEEAKAIALDVSSESKSIDEVTVWIFDTEEAINMGLITLKQYDVIIEKGRVVDVIENELYGK